ncbi:MAG TPA: hypothetical protein VJL34_07925, partial [Anaerolineales bacterium]|nr:hypothetical protein [Anaerolineales bacterium]
MNKKVPPATQAGSPGKFQTAVLWYQFIKRNFRAIQGLRKLDAMRSILVRANVELGKLAWDDPVYAQRIKEFDAAMIESTQGKWLMAQAMESGSKENWKQAFRHMATAHRLGVWIHRSLCSGSSQPIPLPHHQLHQPNAEILFADGVPLVPAINPVVILQGSDYDMGYQYAQQVIEIFGGWIMQKKAAQTFTPEEVESAWRMAVINRHPPAQLLHHSDRGSQYTSEVYLNLLQAAQCQISMS